MIYCYTHKKSTLTLEGDEGLQHSVIGKYPNVILSVPIKLATSDPAKYVSILHTSTNYLSTVARTKPRVMAAHERRAMMTDDSEVEVMNRRRGDTNIPGLLLANFRILGGREGAQQAYSHSLTATLTTNSSLHCRVSHLHYMLPASSTLTRFVLLVLMTHGGSSIPHPIISWTL